MQVSQVSQDGFGVSNSAIGCKVQLEQDDHKSGGDCKPVLVQKTLCNVCMVIRGFLYGIVTINVYVLGAANVYNDFHINTVAIHICFYNSFAVNKKIFELLNANTDYIIT